MDFKGKLNMSNCLRNPHIKKDANCPNNQDNKDGRTHHYEGRLIL